MKRQIAALLTATVLPLAACTATPGSNGTESTGGNPGSVSTSDTSSIPVPSLDSAQSPLPTSTAAETRPLTGEDTPQRSSPAPNSPISGTAPTKTRIDDSVTVPPSVTGGDLAAAEAAIEAWRHAVHVNDLSLQKPSSKNWPDEIHRYIKDPAASVQLDLIHTFTEQHIHQVGFTRYTGSITEATSDHVKIQACVDTRGADVVDATGGSVRGDGLQKFQWTFWISSYRDFDNAWFVNHIDKPSPAKPC